MAFLASTKRVMPDIATGLRFAAAPTFALMAVLGRLLVRLYLTARHERLELEPYLQDGQYRRGDAYAQRTLKTAYGEVKYGRAQLMRRRGGVQR